MALRLLLLSFLFLNAVDAQDEGGGDGEGGGGGNGGGEKGSKLILIL